MKKIALLLLCLLPAFAAKADDPQRAEIKFEKTTIDLGKFGEEAPIQKCAFVFTNTALKLFFSRFSMVLFILAL